MTIVKMKRLGGAFEKAVRADTGDEITVSADPGQIIDVPAAIDAALILDDPTGWRRDPEDYRTSLRRCLHGCQKAGGPLAVFDPSPAHAIVIERDPEFVTQAVRSGHLAKVEGTNAEYVLTEEGWKQAIEWGDE